MKQLYLTIILLCASYYLAGQCDYNNAGFETFIEETVSFDDSNPELQFQVDLPTDHVSIIRFFFYALGIAFGDVEAFDDFSADPQSAIGISQSSDSNTGESAVKIQANAFINFSDLYGVWRCTQLPDSMEFFVKHVGTNADTLFVLSVFDEGLKGVPRDFDELSEFSATATSEFIFDSDTDYERITIPVTENFPADRDTAYLFFVLTTPQAGLDAGNESFILIDDVSAISSNVPVDSDMDGFDSTVDCDDNDDTVFPGAQEICDNKDNNCDGAADEGLDTATFYIDEDGDGFGSTDFSIETCSDSPAGFVENNMDCDDANPNVNPMSQEIPYNGLDDDCDSTTPDDDLDLDGFVMAEDCNDNDSSVNPNATESCNDIDDNCNGETDEGLAETAFFLDFDGDGFGDENSSILACALPSGYVAESGDCNDNDSNVFPGAMDIPDNGIDEDCDGMDATLFVDNDGDGVTNETDCDDNDPTIYPGAEEICDQKDNNCNGETDEGLVLTTYYEDLDSDGFGNPMVAIQTCASSFSGHVTNPEDCDDSDPNINPAAAEACDETDNDCNGMIDDGLVTTVFYIDADNDSFGDPMNSVESCQTNLDGYVINSDDCNDNDSNINPAATEACDESDNDCNGLIDDGLATTVFYSDADNDTYGDPMNSVESCQTSLDGYVTNFDDCDDSNENINPSAVEILDNDVDEDCDGSDLSATFELSNSLLNIYPNPASSYINIEVDGSLDFGTKLYNLDGKLVLHAKNNERLEIGHLDTGTYLLEIKDLKSGQVVTDKITVVR